MSKPAAPVAADLLGVVRPPRNPISRARIETVLSRSVGGIAFVFALQSLPIMLGQLDQRILGSALVMGGSLGVAILAVVVATIIRKAVRLMMGAVSVLYLFGLLVWPFLMRDPTAVLDGKPWLWYLCTVATSCAAIAFPLLWASVYTVVIPIVYGVIRMLPSGGGADALLASLDVIYAILLGQVVVIIIYLLRKATASVDTAQTKALGKYGVAVRQHATEVERVQVDSIVHDNVLATLLAAAGARTGKGAELAATMARNAIARLDEAGAEHADDETVVSFARLGDRIRLAATSLDSRATEFTVVETDMPFVSVPAHISEALYSATLQAMLNSVQHAGATDAGGPGPVNRTLTLGATAEGLCTITIADTGRGFDQSLVPGERLGLRVSIQERVASAGGVVEVRTSLGEGTAISIQWPGPDTAGADAAAAEAEERSEVMPPDEERPLTRANAAPRNEI